MAFDISSITSGAVERPPRIIVSGLPKIGKSSFACGSRCDASGMPVEYGLNNPVVIPVKNEEGVDDIPVPKFPVVNQYEDLIEALRTLYQADHQFETVVIDSISTLEGVVWEAVCRDYGVASIELVEKGYGKGYTIACDYWKKILYALDSLRNRRNMRVILISHVTVRTVADPSCASTYDAYLLSVNSKLGELLTRWADLTTFAKSNIMVASEDVGFKKTEKRAAGAGPRLLYCRANPAYPSGGRGKYGWVKDGIPLNWEAFSKALAAVAGADKKTKQTKKGE